MDDNNKVFIKDMLKKTTLSDTDILIIEDDENTKIMTIRDFVSSIIKDEEVPTKYRLYSSKKIQEIIDILDDKIIDGVGGVQGDIEELETLKATKDELNRVKNDLEIELQKKIDTLEVQNQLALKRNKTDKIASSELDSSSDDVKIKMKNLSQEVIESMTGGTPIPTNKAPVGGWVTEDYADESIISKKLSESYEFVSYVKEGNINELDKHGIYILESTVIGLPKEEGDDSKAKRILYVDRAKDENFNYIKQTVMYSDSTDEHAIFKRSGSVDRIHSIQFVETHDVSTRYKIGRDMLKSDFINKGTISSGSVYLLRDEGHYYAKSTVTELPTVDDYMINVEKYEDKYIFEATKNGTDGTKYTSILYFTSGLMPVTTPWINISTSKKSKFDGKRVCIFGDGIMFGLGSDDISNKSIPALLSNKYGMKITNRAIGDATIGNYEDEQFKERSVLKQIETTPLDNMDYVIIFAGTNDWKSGKAPIGTNNYDINEIYFKGSINKCINNIAAKNPKTNVIFCTPIFRSRTNYGDNRNSDTNTVNDKYLSEFSQAMVDVCKANHLPVVNLHDMGTINKYNASVYLKDGLYPNDLGNELLASKIIGCMESNF